MDSNEIVEIDLTKFLGRMKRQWWIIAIAGLFITFIAASVNYFYLKNEYEASTTLYVGKISQGTISSLLQELQVGQNVIKDYSEIVKSRTVMKETKRLLEQDAKKNPLLEEISALPYKSIADKVSVGLLKDTKIMEIKVSDKNPVVCALVADRVAGIFMDKVKAITKIENIEVVDVAETPDRPVKPNRKKNVAMAFIFGIVLGVGVVVVLELMDNTIKTSNDVKNFLKLPVMGVVNSFDKNELVSVGPELVTLNTPKSAIAEAYRIIRTNLQFSAMDKELKSILVTGSGPNEGKSVTASNLAVVFATAGSKVLLIDGDMRKPNQHNIMKVPNKSGLINILTGNKDFKSCVIKTEIGFLDLLTSGPIAPNPSEALGTKAMKSLMEEVKGIYDVVIVDSPPVCLVTDSQILSSLVDGTLLVAASGEVKVEMVRKATELLTNVSAHVLGVVVNKVKERERDYYYTYGEDAENKTLDKKNKMKAKS